MKQTARMLFFATIIFYAVLWFVPEKKIAFGVITLYGGFLWYRTRSLGLALPLLVTAVTPLILGKQFQIDLVSASRLHIAYRPFGIGVDVIVTMREFASLFMAILLFYEQGKGKRSLVPAGRLGWALFSLPLVITASTLFGSILPSVSLAHSLFYWEPFIWYQFLQTNRVTLDYRIFLAVLSGTLLSEGVITILQVVHGGPFGTVLEYFPDFVPLDLASDIGTSIYRFGGTFPYANSLAHYLVFALLVVLPSLFDPENDLHEETAATLLIGAVAFLLTLSRSAWIAFALGALVFFFAAEKIYRYRLHSTMKLRLPAAIMLGAVILVGLVLMLPRLAGTAYSFEEYGSIRTRELLLTAAIRSFLQYPVFGVGLELWVYAMFQRSQSFSSGLTVFRYFPEPVHNGLIKLLVETGLVGLLSYLVAVTLIIKRLFQVLGKATSYTRIYGLALFAAFVGVFLNSQMQPILPDMPFVVIALELYASSIPRARIAGNSYGNAT